MAYLEDDEKAEADMLKIRIENSIGKKTDRGVDKGLITLDEAKMLCKTVEKLAKKHDVEWWLDEKGFKSMEIITDLLNEAEFGIYETEKEILQKIEKA